MKITKTHLRKIVKEALQRVISEQGDKSLSSLTFLNDPEKSNLYKLPPGEKPNKKTVGYEYGYPERVEWNKKKNHWENRLGEPLTDSAGNLRRPTHDEMDKTRGTEKKQALAQAKKTPSVSAQGMGRPGGKGEIDDPARARTHAIDRKRYKHGASKP